MQYKRISADCHLDMIWLPPDLFTSNAPSALKDQMPFVADQADGTKRWVDNNGADYGMAGGVGASGTPYVLASSCVSTRCTKPGSTTISS